MVGYGGPTVILIRERESGAVWGGCADSPWKESNSFYGGQASFLLRLAPDFKVIPSKMARLVLVLLPSLSSLSLLSLLVLPRDAEWILREGHGHGVVAVMFDDFFYPCFAL